jgi:hypothetical protein
MILMALIFHVPISFLESDLDHKRHLIGDEFYKPSSTSSGESTAPSAVPPPPPTTAPQLPPGRVLVQISDLTGQLPAGSVTGVPTLIPADSIPPPEGATIVYSNPGGLVSSEGIVFAPDISQVVTGSNPVVTAVTLAAEIKREEQQSHSVTSGTLSNASGK